MAEPAWLALLDAPRAGSAPVVDAGTGAGAGHLLVSRGRAKPDRAAVRVAAELIGDGPALAVSLVLPPRGTRPLFDDPAVVHAMRAVLRDPARTVVFSTLVDGSTEWAGALSGIEAARAAGWPCWWAADPFARLGPRWRLP